MSRTTGGTPKTEVSEREVQETVTLHEEHVEVEHNKVDRVLKPEEAAKAFHENTIEMTEVSEKPVITKQAHVIEEVALSKQSGERDVTVSGTVRRQDVTVEEIDRKSVSSKKSSVLDAETGVVSRLDEARACSPGFVRRTAALAFRVSP